MLQTIGKYAEIAAFYGEPLPHETRGRGYLETVCVARIAALQALLGADQCIRYAGGAAKPVAGKRKAVARPRGMTGEEFFDARMVACRAVAAEHGERWDLVAGASAWCSIPARLRSFKTARGTTIRCRRDARLPAARYWPGGRLPDGVEGAATGRGLTPWVCYRPVGVFGHPMLARLEAARLEQIAADKAWHAAQRGRGE